MQKGIILSEQPKSATYQEICDETKECLNAFFSPKGITKYSVTQTEKRDNKLYIHAKVFLYETGQNFTLLLMANITNLANDGYIVRGQCTVISCSEA